MNRAVYHFTSAILTLLLLGCTGLVHAQNEPSPDDRPLPEIERTPAEWGEVTRAELRFSAYPADSNATAVILSDVGQTEFLRNGRLKFSRHTRIKLLTKASYEEFGTVEIPYYAEDRTERVKDVDGQTFLLEENGEVQRYELDKDDIFDEEVTDTRGMVSFTLPNLEPGAVIEYEYEIVTQNPLFLREWVFQTSEPTLYSQYTTQIPRGLEYAVISRGQHIYDKKTTKDVVGMSGDDQRRRWVITDLPALREEPFMTTVDDYLQSVRFQLDAVTNPRTGRTIEDYMTDWEELADELLGGLSFGRQLGRYSSVRQVTRETIAGRSSVAERTRAIYEFIQSSVEWNERHGVFPDPLDEVLERRRGSSDDINMLLCSMLQIAGVEAHPVLTSTRSHGQMMPVYPFVGQFNSVVVAVQRDDSFMLLDATDPFRPLGVLPKHAQNGSGWLVRKDSPTWVTVPPTGQASRLAVVSARLTSEGDLEGSAQVRDQSYTAIEGRHTLSTSDAKTLARSSIFDTAIELDDVTVTGSDDITTALETQASFRIPSHAQVAGDFMYVNPIVIDRETQNPLQRPTRTFPVDFPAPESKTYTLSLQIPEGYDVEEMPENTTIRMGEQTVFQLLANQTGNMISLRVRYVLGQTTFKPEAYSGLQTFFQEIVDASSEPVVLKRIPEPEASTSGR